MAFGGFKWQEKEKVKAKKAKAVAAPAVPVPAWNASSSVSKCPDSVPFKSLLRVVLMNLRGLEPCGLGGPRSSASHL